MLSRRKSGLRIPLSARLWRQLVRPLPQTLWYYTNASTFGRILKTGEVWSTQISCLNDHSEFRYAVRRLRDEIKNYVGHGDEHIRFLAQHLYETLEQDGADTSWFFVFCMSSVADDLSQWRAYGGGEGGVAIGFNPMKLVQGEISTRGYLVPVRYSEQDHKAIVSDVAIGTHRRSRLGALWRKAAALRRAGDCPKGHPNTAEGPMARLVGCQASRLIGHLPPGHLSVAAAKIAQPNSCDAQRRLSALVSTTSCQLLRPRLTAGFFLFGQRRPKLIRYTERGRDPR